MGKFAYLEVVDVHVFSSSFIEVGGGEVRM